MMLRGTCTAVAIAAVTACGGVDQQKFDAVYRAGKALQVEVNTTGGVGRQCEALQKEFATEVSALDGRDRGKEEGAALQAFKEANDAYRFFLRFRSLDFEAVEGRILLMGTNLEVASRYGLPVETRGTSQWTDSGNALKVLLAAAELKLAEANDIVNGR
jgi:hypothetical protein